MVKQFDGTVSSKNIEQLLNERKSCPYCGKKMNGNKEIDHLDPISKGGLHSKSNLIACCHKCNALKHDKEFYKWLEFVPNERKKIVEHLYLKKLGRLPD